jgi:hypothetical protein
LAREPGRKNYNMTDISKTAPGRNSQSKISPTLLAVYDGRECAGFILARGKLGFEAFSADQKSLGLYPSQREAAHALDEVRP